MTTLENFRHQKDDFFEHDQHSPLTPEQKQDFEGLNTSKRILVCVSRSRSSVSRRQKKSRSRPQRAMFRATSATAVLTLTVEGEKAALTVYRNEHGFFLPFADALAGDQTYGAGRYLEPEPAGDCRLLVDFNLAYNPYSAYNPNWSCPITPVENRLKVAIRVGNFPLNMPVPVPKPGSRCCTISRRAGRNGPPHPAG